MFFYTEKQHISVIKCHIKVLKTELNIYWKKRSHNHKNAHDHHNANKFKHFNIYQAVKKPMKNFKKC